MYCTPEVSGDLLFVGSCSGFFFALDKDTGKPKWSYDIKQDGEQRSFHGDILITDDLVIIGTDRGTGHVYAFEKKTGKVRWKYPAGLGVATAIIRKGKRIYFATLDDRIVCLNLKNGKENWVFSTNYSSKKSFFNHAPAVVSDTVFYGGLNGMVYAVDARSGKLKWKTSLGKRVSTRLAISGNSLYVGTYDNRLYKLNQHSGAIEKSFNVEGKPRESMTVIKNSIIVFVNWMLEGGEILSLDLSLEHVFWRQKAPGGAAWFSAKPYLFQDFLLFGTNRGDIVALGLDDGVKMWTHRLEGEEIRVFGSSGNVLYIGTIKGNLYACQLTEP